MNIGCVKEIKPDEYRVGLTPENVRTYIRHGHLVYMQSGAGLGTGYTDEDYRGAGAEIYSSAVEVFAVANMIVKVKEPLEPEYPLLRKGQILFTYLHLAASRELTVALLNAGVSGVAYETIRDSGGGLPLLKPMSEIAGRMSVQEGAKCLEKPSGGRGVLLPGVPGVPKAKIAIIGGGVVGTNACKMAIGLGADVTILDMNIRRLTYLDDIFGSRIQTLFSNDASVESVCRDADLVIGAVLIPGAAAPKLIKKEYLKGMRPGSVIVDVAIDQGGCCETSKATYYQEPTFVVDGIVHYCVANMPGAVPYTSTIALTNTTLPYGLAIADYGLHSACERLPGLTSGINTYDGQLTCKEVGEAFGLKTVDLVGLMWN